MAALRRHHTSPAVVGDSGNDPVDHARTSRQRVGEALKYRPHAPGLLATMASVVPLAVALFTLAHGQLTACAIAATVAVLLGGAGLGWLLYTHRRVRSAQLRWQATSVAQAHGPHRR